MKAVRFETNPLITPAMLPGSDGSNINGPSVIPAPAWLDRPLGRYYLYFAHHGGTYIRLATADDLRGPWRVHEPGTLRLEQSAGRAHVASPDVHVDDERREIRMYFHAVRPEGETYPHGQVSYLARSGDGLAFEAGREIVAPFYLRAFPHEGRWFGLSKGGNDGGLLVGSPDGDRPFEVLRQVLPRMRHAAVRRTGPERMEVYFSRGGDAPERILRCRLAMAGDPSAWTFDEPEDILRPTEPYEGAGLPVVPSRWGAAREPVRQLRDPAIYEEDGRAVLFYSVAGEQGLAGAELFDE